MHSNKRLLLSYGTVGIFALSVMCGFLLVVSLNMYHLVDGMLTTRQSQYATIFSFPASILSVDPTGEVLVLANFERMGGLQKIQFVITPNTLVRRQEVLIENDTFVGVLPLEKAALADVTPGRHAYILIHARADGRYEAVQITLDALFYPVRSE